MKIMNDFWTLLGLCTDDLMYTQEPKSVCEICDVAEFISYGEERCKQLGIEDDEEMADFLIQAFDGDIHTWYLTLPKQVQSSWFHLKNALYDEFGQGEVMEAMHLLRQICWLVPNYEQVFDIIWRIYEQVSFFESAFLQGIKEQMLEKYAIAKVKLEHMYAKVNANEALNESMHKDIVEMDSLFEEIMIDSQHCLVPMPRIVKKDAKSS